MTERDDNASAENSTIGRVELLAKLNALSASPTISQTARVLEVHYTRRAWKLNPTIRLFYSYSEDSLYAELIAAEGTRTETFHRSLAVEFDGDDPDAMPTALCLQDLNRHPDSPAAGFARKILGELVWKRALQLAADGGEGSELVLLGPDSRLQLIEAWRKILVLPTFAVGVRVLPSRVFALLIDSVTGKAGASVDVPLDHNDGPQVALKIAQVARDLASSHYSDDVVASGVIGIELGGPVNPVTGVVEHYNKRGLLARWEDFDLGSFVEDKTGLRTVVVNDAEAYGHHEGWASEGRGPEVQGLLLISEGIGGSVISNGRVDRRFPMEIGKLSIEPVTGRDCGCGKRGCIEATAGLGALLSDVAAILGKAVTLEQAIDEASENDDVLRVFSDAGLILARGLADCQYIVKPMKWLVYLPPELYARKTKASGALLGKLEHFDRHVAWESFTKEVQVVQRLAGDEEGAHGAGLAALDRFEAPVLRNVETVGRE